MTTPSEDVPLIAGASRLVATPAHRRLHSMPAPPPVILTSHDLNLHYSDDPESEGYVFSDLAAIIGLSARAIPYPLWARSLTSPSPQMRLITPVPCATMLTHTAQFSAKLEDYVRQPRDITAPYIPRVVPSKPIDFIEEALPSYLPPVKPPRAPWVRFQRLLVLRSHWTAPVEHKKDLMDEATDRWDNLVAAHTQFDIGPVSRVIWLPQPKPGTRYPPELVSCMLEMRRDADKAGTQAYERHYAHAARMRAYMISLWCETCPNILLSVSPEGFIRRWPISLQNKLQELEIEALTAGATKYRMALDECDRKIQALLAAYDGWGLLNQTPTMSTNWWLSSWWKVPQHSANVVYPALLANQLEVVMKRFRNRDDMFWFCRAFLFSMFKEHERATGQELTELRTSRFPAGVVLEAMEAWKGWRRCGLEALEDTFMNILSKFRMWEQNPNSNIEYSQDEYCYRVGLPFIFNFVRALDVALGLPDSVICTNFSIQDNRIAAASASSEDEEDEDDDDDDDDDEDEDEEDDDVEEVETPEESQTDRSSYQTDDEVYERESDWDPQAERTKDELRFEACFRDRLYKSVRTRLDLAKPLAATKVAKRSRRLLPRRLSTLRFRSWLTGDREDD